MRHSRRESDPPEAEGRSPGASDQARGRALPPPRFVGLPDYFAAELARQPDGVMYTALADAVSMMVTDGVLPPGDRLPSLRSVASRLGVSLTTAVRAYRLLIERGLADARAQSGYFVAAPRVEGLPCPVADESAGPSVAAETIVAHGPEIGRQSQLPMPDCLRPGGGLRRAVMRGVTAFAQFDGYAIPANGLYRLRRELAKMLSVGRCSVDADHLSIVDGSRGAFDMALRCISPACDAIAVQSPMPMAVYQQIAAHGAAVLEVAADPSDGIDPEALERVLAEERVGAVVVAADYANPTGGSMPDSARDRLIAVTAMYGVPLIELDVFADLGYSGDRSPPLAARGYPHVLTCGGLAEVAAPGFGVGWLLAPGYRTEATRLLYCSGAGAFSQVILTEYIASGDYDRYLQRARRRLHLQIECMRGAIAREWPKGVRLTRPGGGVALWASLPFPVAQIDWTSWLGADRSVRIVPGRAFTVTGRYRECLRVSLNEPWSARVEDAFHELGRLLKLSETPVLTEVSGGGLE